MAKSEKFVAKHQIEITTEVGKPGDKAKGVAPVRPKTASIKPNTRVMADPEDDRVKELIDSNSLVKAEKDDEAKAQPLFPEKKTGGAATKSGTAAKTGASAKKDDDTKDLV